MPKPDKGKTNRKTSNQNKQMRKNNKQQTNKIPRKDSSFFLFSARGSTTFFFNVWWNFPMKPSRFGHSLVFIVARSSLPVPPRTWCLWVGGNSQAWGGDWGRRMFPWLLFPEGVVLVSTAGVSPVVLEWLPIQSGGPSGLPSVATLGLGLDGLILLGGGCKTLCSCVIPLDLGFRASSPSSYHPSFGKFSFGSLLHFF